jgi:hypothetical protein
MSTLSGTMTVSAVGSSGYRGGSAGTAPDRNWRSQQSATSPPGFFPVSGSSEPVPATDCLFVLDQSQSSAGLTVFVDELSRALRCPFCADLAECLQAVYRGVRLLDLTSCSDKRWWPAWLDK